MPCGADGEIPVSQSPTLAIWTATHYYSEPELAVEFQADPLSTLTRMPFLLPKWAVHGYPDCESQRAGL